MVMPAEFHDLRIQLGVVPVGLRDHRLGVVEHHDFGNSTQGPERVLQRTDERLRRQSPDGLGVAFPGKAQHQAKDMGLTTDSLFIQAAAPVP